MKYIITENKLENVVIKYLDRFYGDLREYKTDKNPAYIFFVKNGKAYMKYKVTIDVVWVDYGIYNDLENVFSLNYEEITSIIEKWIKLRYNVKGLTPVTLITSNHIEI